MPAANLEASESAPKPAQALHDAVEVLAKDSDDNCSGNDSKVPQENENTHLNLSLVNFLKSCGVFYLAFRSAFLGVQGLHSFATIV